MGVGILFVKRPPQRGAKKAPRKEPTMEMIGPPVGRKTETVPQHTGTVLNPQPSSADNQGYFDAPAVPIA
ncbi:hypothetical protein KIN20_013635 [Parelaphostrongylus tenuis]|uniref:Uncharacterized protein n=1 Tax=Parelaphostrongylus tenuis TaxID=148309 RepID=A0AAD5N2A6_PARTN|nr:hypothetical protein KIN20_013635 [Parelaphostrongylus tenuis]